MVDELFKILGARGITSGPNAFEVISELSVEEILILALDCFASVQQLGLPPENKLFTFSPISSIAGGPTPCSNVPCRLEAAYSLSLISALYAEKIILPNFFDYMFHIVNGDARPPESEGEFNAFAYNLASDIAVCFEYKPLFDAGLAEMNFTTPTVCLDCSKRHQLESKNFQNELTKILRKVDPIFNSKVKFMYKEHEYIDVQNDNNYLGGQLGWSISNDLLAAMRKHDKQIPYELTNKEISRFGLRDNIIDTSINDILEYDFYPGLKSGTFLTNREFDIDLIENTTRNKGSHQSTKTLPKFHKVNYLHDILIEDAVKLRQSNEDSFKVYRNAVLEMVNTKDSAQANNFFEAVVNPAIDNVNNVISQHKKECRARAGRKITTRTVITVSGLAAANLLGIPLGIAGTAAGLAGITNVNDIIDDLQASRSTPEAATTNPYYFMWGLKQGHAD